MKSSRNRQNTDSTAARHSAVVDSAESGHRPKLTHVDAQGAARMVDVSAKPDVVRMAAATGYVRTTAEVVKLLERGELEKGDPLATARIAGIMGAKRTADLIPLCHPIELTAVTVDLTPDETGIGIRATAKTCGPTGVEMEALTAVAVAGLALHDMIKAVDPAATLEQVQVQHKDGGKTGRWVRPLSDRVPQL